jgi:hypothetical protein
MILRTTERYLHAQNQGRSMRPCCHPSRKSHIRTLQNPSSRKGSNTVDHRSHFHSPLRRMPRLGTRLQRHPKAIALNSALSSQVHPSRFRPNGTQSQTSHGWHDAHVTCDILSLCSSSVFVLQPRTGNLALVRVSSLLFFPPTLSLCFYKF